MDLWLVSLSGEPMWGL